MYVAVRNAEIGSLSARSGIIVFNSPNKMQWKKPQVIAAVLSEKISSDNLKERIKKYGMVDSSKITISNKMEVRLSGEPAFDIRPITPLVQAITKDQITEWKWQVTPLQRGKQILFLTASIYIVDKATDIPRVVESLEREITVEVTIPELLAGLWNDYWQWILATVVFPLVIYGWRQGLKRWKSRHRFDFDG
jgi:hypothetical protein